MGRDFRLVEDNVRGRIDSGGDVGGSDLARVRRQFLRLLPDRDRVHVDDAIDAFMRLLQRNEIADRAKIIAEMQVAGGLYARKNAVVGLFHRSNPWSRARPETGMRRVYAADAK